MMPITMEHLISCFNDAKEFEATYIAVVLSMEGYDAYEYIINPHPNFDTKLAYYQNTYDNDLKHKFAKGIRIVDVKYGDYFEDIEWSKWDRI
ncbi:hypothetical protein P4V38_12445 [Cytobacillus firmus]|nr:hypothetical protein [Cytobacillus firmus]MED1906742.1 hypothetical protein [Cytobacillus firmus]